jgi:hypothetical protein
LAASDVWGFSQRSLPLRLEADVHAHIHPSYVWFTAPLASGSVDPLHRAQSLGWCHRPGPHCPESPFASLGCDPAASRVPTTSASMTRPSSRLRAHAPDLHPLTAYARWLGPGVCAGCRVPPAGPRPCPMFSPPSLWRCLDPYPAALLRCPDPCLPAEPRPHLTCKRCGALTLPP